MNRAAHQSLAIIVTAVGVCWTGITAEAVQRGNSKAKKEVQGGHPLAGRNGSLEDLLEMPDWGGPPAQPAIDPRDSGPRAAAYPEQPRDKLAAERPRVDPQPLAKPTAPAANPRLEIERLIAERNQIIDRCDLFETMERVFREQAVFAQRLAFQRAAAAELHAAQLGRNQVLALGEAGKPHQGDADNRVRNAERQLREANGAVEKQVSVLQPLYNKIGPEIPRWLQTYAEMRAWLKPDRRDPNRPAVHQALQAAITRRNDFYEGHVLAALAGAYDGDADAADKHLAEACKGYARLRLFFSPLGPDCCHTYLLLGKPEMVRDWVNEIKKMNAGKPQTSLLCWLVGNAEMLDGKDNEAKKYLDRALTKVAAFGKPPKPLPEPLVGDAAFFYATTSNGKLLNLEKAKELLAKVPEKSDAWEVLRARAAVLFAEGKEAEGRTALEACRERAPKVLNERLDGLLGQTPGWPGKTTLVVVQ